MADDNSARYRSTEPFGGGASATPASDPLAELARLIGRGVPLAENAREARAPAQPAPETKARYVAIAQELVSSGATAIVLGCTEIPLLISQADFTVPVFDTVKIHADAIVDYLVS